MSATREDENLILPQKFSSGDYLFFYDAGDNNVVGLLHTCTYSEDTPQAYNTDDDVVDIMGDDMLDAM